MDIVIKLSQFLLSLSLLIILHEFGHYFPAKLFKTRVEKFYLFFDVKFSLFKKKIGETVYGIGWLPLGGYVKISGMIDESMDTDQMSQPAQPWEFRSKPAWQRLIIMLGGVTVNFILAFVICIGMTFAYGDLYLKNSELKDGVEVSDMAKKLGFATGDKIVAIDGEKIEKFNDVNPKLPFAHTVTIERNGAKKTLTLPENLLGDLSKSHKGPLVYPRNLFAVREVEAKSPNAKVLKPKDAIVSFNGVELPYFDQVMAMRDSLKGKTVDAVVLRDQKRVPVKITVSDKGTLGIFPSAVDDKSLEKLGVYKFDRTQYGFFESIPVGISKGADLFAGYWKQLKAIFTPSTGAYKGLGGFFSIFNVFPENWSWEVFWGITAFLSVMLGVLNLLPIPALDGGHVMFLLFEIITGRKPSDKFLERAQIVGIVLLLALVLFANGNDIFRAIMRK